MKNQLTLFIIILFFVMPSIINAQSISGIVKGSEGSIIGASISVAPGVGTVTDLDGKYTLPLAAGKYTVTVSFLGYVPQKRNVTLVAGENQTWDVTLKEDMISLENVVVVGTRTAPRSSTDAPVPIDVMSVKELQSTGQLTFDKALQYKVPSFNTVQTPVNDATSLVDPYEIRNMGPSRTLILINGKRKNPFALVYTQMSPGRGESGADISAIPTDAIKRVEILRDGASAQYGSDAIAGVMNVILKDNDDEGSVTLRSGITSKGDGEMFGVSVNNGAPITDKGFLNYTIDFSKVNLANRAGIVSAEGDAADYKTNIDVVKAFLAKKPDAGNINGSPETTAAKFLMNGGFNIDANTQLYANAAYVYKKVNSFANYRTPYWQKTDYGLLTPAGQDYMGYGPTFDGDLNDYNGTIGVKSTKNGWNTDISFTTGGNTQEYTVRNTINQSLGKASPIVFRPGGYKFTNNIGNIDISRKLSEKVSFGVGSEFRSENYEILAGDEASYTGTGADSYAGNSKENSFKSNRYNIGGYADLAIDLTKNFLINGTARIENYSDFGNAFVWKFSTRYKLINDKLTLRGSVSTGFRAPALQQIYIQKAQYSFVPGQGIQVQGLVNNVSPQAKLIGVPPLGPEKSTNISVGFGSRLTDKISITLDYYNISVKDRIVLSQNIGPGKDTTSALNQLLKSNNIVSLYFFANALDSRTSGIDLVTSYRNIAVGSGNLSFNLAGNYTLENKRIGDIRTPKIITDAKQSLLSPTEEALMFTSRPVFKGILGIDYTIKKFTFTLGNTVFGPAKFRNAGLDKNLEIEFLTKLVTDLGINFQLNSKTTFSFNVNNIFNVLPEWKFVALTPAGLDLLNTPAKVKVLSDAMTFNQRYPVTTYDGSHFSQLGTLLNLSVNVKF
ncbi:MAG: TonB-dependent receptor [Bacteroidia bacterium]